jgi:two-component system OmpR family sensor kinase
LNARERESLLKTFGISFVSLLLVSALTLFFYYKEQKRFYHDQILSEMVAFSYSLEGTYFDVDFVDAGNETPLATLQVEADEVYGLFALPESPKLLKVIQPYEDYDGGIAAQQEKIVLLFGGVAVFLLLFSLFFAFYALHPLRDALRLMEEFLKDIIHDLNTPVTAIGLNSQLLKRKYDDDEIRRIETSAKTIGSLYKNLEVLNRELPLTPEPLALEPFFNERIDHYRLLYPALDFVVHGEEATPVVNKDAFTRIIDNLLSNACKYNVADGTVEIAFNEERVIVRDTGVGIDDTQKAFERFYKESDRGLGLGLNIVRKLSGQMGIGIELSSQKGVGTTFILTFPR